MQVWAPTFCRSTLAFYEALARELRRPLRICIAQKGLGQRAAIGFTADEFAHLDIVDVSGEPGAALQALEERKTWPQLFGAYQGMPKLRRILRTALEQGCRVGLASEAPCNMDPPGYRRIARAAYVRYVLPTMLNDIVHRADFIVNWSGDATLGMTKVGWAAEKVIPCGYFPPPLLGSQLRSRGENLPVVPHLLSTGSLTWHRGTDVFIQALTRLKEWNLPFRATVTGTGPLAPQLEAMVKLHALKCDFLGSVTMDTLIDLYESCSIYVAAGREEPWGIRVNDAINCGAPSIVSRGMGSHKLVLDYGFGATFGAGDAADLAWQIRRLLEESKRYQTIADNLSAFRADISPAAAAARVAAQLARQCPAWHGSNASDED